MTAYIISIISSFILGYSLGFGSHRDEPKGNPNDVVLIRKLRNNLYNANEQVNRVTQEKDKKDKEISELKAENEELKCKLDDVERRIFKRPKIGFEINVNKEVI